MEKRITSVKPTINAINGILRDFGFEGFKLEEDDDAIGFYKIVRPNGQNAYPSLSEGEKTFITFLYFYNLIKGGLSENGINTDRVIVFDDPISSLDSQILFIVSTLIRKVIEETRKGSFIKQAFIMTHNLYFHKEVAYRQEKEDVSFWLLKKHQNFSEILRFKNENPIKTNYEMLWIELEEDNLKPLTIQNTLRRILEYYFKTMGDISFFELQRRFKEQELLDCLILFPWIHDGSHCIDDGIYITPNLEDAGRYLKIFEKVFSVMGHSSHYKMMKKKAQNSASSINK